MNGNSQFLVRPELDPLNFAEEKRSRRRQAWTERWEGDCQAKTHVVGIAELVGVVGPLSLKELSSNWRKAGFDRNETSLKASL
jgi:hypothetical protein